MGTDQSRSRPAAGLAAGEKAPGVAAPAPAHAPRTRRAWASAALLLLAFLAVTAATRTHAVSHLDQQLHTWAVAHRSTASVEWARAVTRAGSSVLVLPAVLVGGVLAATGPVLRRLSSGALLAAACVLGLLARVGVAHLVGRARPPQPDWAGAAGGFAFPSGHTTAATLGAGLLAWAVARHLRAGPARVAVTGAAVVAAAAVGWSRVWLGVHWPTDVLGAWLFAAACLALLRVAQLRLLPPSGFATRRRRPQD